jgi:hypothetical protein
VNFAYFSESTISKIRILPVYNHQGKRTAHCWSDLLTNRIILTHLTEQNAKELKLRHEIGLASPHLYRSISLRFELRSGPCSGQPATGGQNQNCAGG